MLSPYVLRAHSGHGSLEFVENQGQWKEPFLYKAMTGACDVYLEKNGFTFMLGDAANSQKMGDFKHGKLKEMPLLKYHAYKVIFEGSQDPSKVEGSKPQQHHYNYFLGNDPTRWRSNIHPNYAVDYSNLYPGVDLHVASEKGIMKYDLIIQPGTGPDMVRMRYDGAEGLAVKEGMLVVKTSVGDVREMPPYAYQYVEGKRVEVACNYKVKGDIVSFSFPKGYDQSKLLVIDPTVVFATLTGSPADNWGFTATYDAQGNLYAGGGTSGPGYPGATGSSYQGGGTGGGNTGFPSDITISKFQSTPNTILWSTYIGGGDNDQPHSMIIDGSGNLFIAGRTYSSNFPVQNAFDASHNNGADIVVVKLNASGSLTSSTYVGGAADDGVNISSVWGVTNTSLKHSYADDARSEIIADNTGNVYIAASTQSLNFPTVNASKGTLSGTQDAVVFKLDNNLTNMLWSTYLGGNNDDAAYVLALNQAQTSIYVAGGMNDGGIPGAVTGGSFDPTFNSIPGTPDGFIARYQNSGTYAITRGTYIGTSAYDQIFGIQVDLDDNVYICGNTLGAFPVKAASASIYQNANSSQFIMKLDANLNTNIYSTVYGSGTTGFINITPTAFLVDTCQNVYISGWGGTTAGNNSSSAGMPTNLTTTTPAGILSASIDGSDFYFICLSKNAISLLFAAYYGSNIAEHVDGGTSRFDKNGVIYQAICGNCGVPTNALPTTPAAHSAIDGSTNCNLAALKIEFNLGAVKANIDIKPDKVVCLGEQAHFQNNSSNGTSYEWDFGDGVGTSTQFVPNPYVYNKAGTFNVRMIVTNPDACKVKDTAYLTITVDTVKINADFEVEFSGNCSPYDIKIKNNSQFSKTPGSQSFTSFTWDFGDGKTGTGFNPSHTYADTGTYTIRMTMRDTTSCNSPDTVSRQVTFSNFNVKAGFEMPPVCERNKLVFNNTSTLAKTYFWDFGDGDISTDMTPTHEYDTAGLYQVKLVAYNDLSCNKADSIIKTMEVRASPYADFDFSPKFINPDEDINKPITFRNKSLNAETYNWNFGDNTGSEERDPVHFYKKSGIYTVCLAVKNQFDCWDTICKPVRTEVQPIVDVPSAFSPNGDGKNDVFYVRGGAVEKVTLRVYNRWGELIFEAIDVQANDPAHGWDGTYKEKQQEMEAYGFVVNATFIDGRTFYKKGNVTLIR
jgi:gliding motility-associated-like protein